MSDLNIVHFDQLHSVVLEIEMLKSDVLYYFSVDSNVLIWFLSNLAADIGPTDRKRFMPGVAEAHMTPFCYIHFNITEKNGL